MVLAAQAIEVLPSRIDAALLDLKLFLCFLKDKTASSVRHAQLNKTAAYFLYFPALLPFIQSLVAATESTLQQGICGGN